MNLEIEYVILKNNNGMTPVWWTSSHISV